jgi:hypothetical protein
MAELDPKASATLVWMDDDSTPTSEAIAHGLISKKLEPNPHGLWELGVALVIGAHPQAPVVPWIKTGSHLIPPGEVPRLYEAFKSGQPLVI